MSSRQAGCPRKEERRGWREMIIIGDRLKNILQTEKTQKMEKIVLV